jgi:hypothetical protein
MDSGGDCKVLGNSPNDPEPIFSLSRYFPQILKTPGGRSTISDKRRDRLANFNISNVIPYHRERYLQRTLNNIATVMAMWFNLNDIASDVTNEL